ncbi:MAG: sigma 54-interacting transcriptional regulator [Thermodesulfobacteriota bacterium]
MAPSHPDIDWLKEISQWVTSVVDVDELLKLITHSATRILRAKASSLLLLNPKTKRLYFKVATGEKKEEVSQFEISLGQGIAGLVAQTGEPLLIRDVTKDDRWCRQISESTGFETRSLACVPLKVDGKVAGVMEIIDKEDGNRLSQEDMELITVFADLAAKALAGANRFALMEQENRNLKASLGDRYRIVGESLALKKVMMDAYKVAGSVANTLILGESGTGKELLARLIHCSGPRKGQPLVILNCAALPETLLEAELFGYERGAFTGATERKAGKIELADGGTLFLDEIGEMALIVQAKLLRVFQEGQFYRLGGTQPISVDVRVIAATNRNIEQDVKDGRFREDLFYRLNVIQMKMPALRDRKEDIPLLAQYFLGRFRRELGLPDLRISEKASRRMMEYDWPGNVRELRNALERASVMGDGRLILPEDLPIRTAASATSVLCEDQSMKEAVDAFKKELIKSTLEKTEGNRTQCARILGVQRTYLSRLLKTYGIAEE